MQSTNIDSLGIALSSTENLTCLVCFVFQTKIRKEKKQTVWPRQLRRCGGGLWLGSLWFQNTIKNHISAYCQDINTFKSLQMYLNINNYLAPKSFAIRRVGRKTDDSFVT